MPELPEVETIKRGLQQSLVGLKIRSIEVFNPKTFEADTNVLVGATVKRLCRRAKVLMIEVEGDAEYTILFHLKMSGQLIFQGQTSRGQDQKVVGGHPTKDMLDQMPNKSTRVIFEFTDSSHKTCSYLYFNDQRKFGWIKLVKTSEVEKNSFLKNLGPEPLSREFTWQVLKTQLLKYKTWPVKVALMDQIVIAGIGNIYASEACFIAKIDPRRKILTLTDTEFKKLYKGIKESLETSIKYGGSTRTHFVNSAGQKGYFLDFAFVYDRENQGCRVCHQMIKRITQAGRSSYLCPYCQH